MSFCTACGAQVDPSSTFCTKCGAKMAPAAGTSSTIGAATPPAKKSNALKIVLIVLGVLFVIGLAITAAGIFAVKKVVDSAKIEASGDGKDARISVGGVSVAASGDEEKVLKGMAIERYPNATLREDSAGEISIGGGHIYSAIFESSDSPAQVLEFYRGKYPNANVIDTAESKMISWNEKDEKASSMIVINEEEGKTVITMQHTRRD